MWTTYPKAAEILSEKESMIGIFRKGIGFEEYLPIIKLFAKEGKNLFSDVTIPAEYSVDGKEHVVNSQEEFYRYYKDQRERMTNKILIQTILVVEWYF